MRRFAPLLLSVLFTCEGEPAIRPHECAGPILAECGHGEPGPCMEMACGLCGFCNTGGQ